MRFLRLHSAFYPMRCSRGVTNSWDVVERGGGTPVDGGRPKPRG